MSISTSKIKKLENIAKLLVKRKRFIYSPFQKTNNKEFKGCMISKIHPTEREYLLKEIKTIDELISQQPIRSVRVDSDEGRQLVENDLVGWPRFMVFQSEKTKGNQ